MVSGEGGRLEKCARVKEAGGEMAVDDEHLVLAFYCDRVLTDSKLSEKALLVGPRRDS